nr:MAG TPA: hypothetical protein [Caudoviricetes sp.]
MYDNIRLQHGYCESAKNWGFYGAPNFFKKLLTNLFLYDIIST